MERGLRDIRTYFEKVPSFLKGELLSSVNAGILGGNDLEFIKYYKEYVEKFIRNNIEIIDNHSGISSGALNVVYEQILFSELARKKNKMITPLYDFLIGIVL